MTSETKVSQYLKNRIDTSLLELKILEATIPVLLKELDSICKNCEHFKIPAWSQDKIARCQLMIDQPNAKCDVITYRTKLTREKF